MQDFNYQLEGQDFKGQVFLPALNRGDTAPAVLVFHDWGGCNEMAQNYAKSIADLDMVGIAVDMYGDGRTGHSVDEKMALYGQASQDRARLVRLSEAAIVAAKAHPQVDSDRIVAIGFCFGGMCVLDLARSGANLSGVVSFHGALAPSSDVATKHITAPIMIFHGDSDKMVPFSDVSDIRDELNAAKADWQMTIYANTHHAFMNPEADDEELGTVYNKVVASKAWESFQLFLLDVFAET